MYDIRLLYIKSEVVEMEEHFVVAYEKDKVLRQKEIEEEALMINLINLKKSGFTIVNIRDKFFVDHKLEDIEAIFRESIDIEYEDVKSKLEAYNIAFEYYKNLYRNNYINKETYNKYISKMKEYRKEIKDKEEFINKVKELYMLEV